MRNSVERVDNVRDFLQLGINSALHSFHPLLASASLEGESDQVLGFSRPQKQLYWRLQCGHQHDDCGFCNNSNGYPNHQHVHIKSLSLNRMRHKLDLNVLLAPSFRSDCPLRWFNPEHCEGHLGILIHIVLALAHVRKRSLHGPDQPNGIRNGRFIVPVWVWRFRQPKFVLWGYPLAVQDDAGRLLNVED